MSKKTKKLRGSVPRPIVLSDVGLRMKQIDASPVLHFKIRYSCSTTGSFSITRADLLSRLVMATGATVAYRLFTAVRVTEVEIFGSGTGTSVEVQWISENGPTKVVGDVSTSPAYPAHLISKPPMNSLASQWSTIGSNESTVLMRLNSPLSGCILDLTFNAVLGDAHLGETVATAISISGGTAGNIGSPALDHSAGSPAWTPLAWPSYS
jgi:hypothetical protein